MYTNRKICVLIIRSYKCLYVFGRPNENDFPERFLVNVFNGKVCVTSTTIYIYINYRCNDSHYDVRGWRDAHNTKKHQTVILKTLKTAKKDEQSEKIARSIDFPRWSSERLRRIDYRMYVCYVRNRRERSERHILSRAADDIRRIVALRNNISVPTRLRTSIKVFPVGWTSQRPPPKRFLLVFRTTFPVACFERDAQDGLQKFPNGVTALSTR